MADLHAYLESPTNKLHVAYAQSALAPAAPEYSVGDVLLASAYRALVLEVRDSHAQSSWLDKLPERIAIATGGTAERMALAGESWTQLLNGQGGLAAPRLEKGKDEGRLIPFVPELARYTGFLGDAPDRRWQPARLLASAVWCGTGPDEAQGLLNAFGEALAVQAGDDYLARYAETILAASRHPDELTATPPKPALTPEASLWRSPRGSRLAPAERFAADMPLLIALKGAMTRRQWTLLVDAHLRLSLSMYMLWLCHANMAVWRLMRASFGGAKVTEPEVAAAIWDDPASRALLEVGSDPSPAVDALLSSYAEARLGINLVLHALDAPDAPKIGEVVGTEQPAAAIARLLEDVRAGSAVIAARLQAERGQTIDEAMSQLMDDQRDLMLAQRGTTNNMSEFLRHVMAQLRTYDRDERMFDQGYLWENVSKGRQAKWRVRLSPITLMLLVHLSQETVGSVPATMADLQATVADYGMHVSGSELKTGVTAASMDDQGLVVDSPDAGGGRLLVDALGQLR